jgi:hypothetical protein
MDDGYGSGKGFYICTESYSFIEHELLVKIMKNKFNLVAGQVEFIKLLMEIDYIFMEVLKIN